jgi:group I intron endonuclease
MIGIYIIKNKINGKIYIGQSWNIEKRWIKHKKEVKNLKNGSRLVKSIRKYGFNNFEFFLLEKFTNKIPQKALSYFENYYINFYNSKNPSFGYNMKRGYGRN